MNRLGIIFALICACFNLQAQTYLPFYLPPVSAVPSPNVAWYKFTEGSGTTTADSSGNGFTGTLGTGVVFTNIPGGTHGLYFNGLGSVSTTCNTVLGDLTANVWFYAVSGSNAVSLTARLIDKRYDIGFWIGKSGTSLTNWGGGILQTNIPFGDFSTVSLSATHMLTMTRIGTTKSIYIDAVLVTNVNVSSSLTSTNLLFIGGDELGGSNDRYRGILADVGIWNFGLSSNQVTSWYLLGSN